MLVKSALVTDASGSVGGLTWSRNRGGQYVRARVVPTNPNTSFQAAVRGFVSQLASLWVNTLTVAQRAAWDAYAINVSTQNRLGDDITVTGLNMYVRTNVPALQALFARQDDAPTIFDLGDYTIPAIVASETLQQVAVVFTDTDDWVDEDDAGMLVYVSRPKNPSVNFFKGPYRFAGSIDGDSVTPPTSPANIAVPFPVVAGQKLFTRAQVLRADGRLSSDVMEGRLVVT